MSFTTAGPGPRERVDRVSELHTGKAKPLDQRGTLRHPIVYKVYMAQTNHSKDRHPEKDLPHPHVQ